MERLGIGDSFSCLIFSHFPTLLEREAKKKYAFIYLWLRALVYSIINSTEKKAFRH